jgi:hypothetical protein
VATAFTSFNRNTTVHATKTLLTSRTMKEVGQLLIHR